MGSLGLLHDVEGDPKQVPDGLHQLTVGPDPHERRHLRPGPLQDQSPAVAVLQAGRSDQHGHQQAGGVGDDVPLAVVDLLARVVPARIAPDSLGALDGLGVDDPGRGRRLPPGGLPDRVAERVVDPVGRASSSQRWKFQ